MGLNDLTLEKLISEINGYKEKMRAIHEDYGRASQDLQDRINVLGYTLNEHLKETKDQMATTPQRLLNLETKYVTGEVSDTEYTAQRQEFKGLLERNLRSIEEIKSMIDVLSHIETKPLSPGEFKQSYSNTAKPTTAADWNRTAFNPSRPSPLIPQSTPPLTTAVQVPLAPQDTNLSSEVTVHSDPQPPVANSLVPQTIENNTPSLESSNNPTIPAPIDIAASQNVTISADPSVQSLVIEPTGSDPISAAPSPDVVEDIADALVVKVVDDVPLVDASSAVAATETAQIQPAVPGTETIPNVQPSQDLSTVGLAPPSQFYKVVCPKCGADVPKPAKVWELKGGKSKKNVLIGLFQCQDCRVKFREALTREIL